MKNEMLHWVPKNSIFDHSKIEEWNMLHSVQKKTFTIPTTKKEINDWAKPIGKYAKKGGLVVELWK